MPADHILGDRYRIRETDAGLLKITDTQDGNDVIEHDPGNDRTRLVAHSDVDVEVFDTQRSAVAYRYSAAATSGDASHDFQNAPVSMPEATIGDGDAISQVEFGQTSLDPGASSNNTTDDSAIASESITFSTTFDSAPRIILGHRARSGVLLESAFANVSTTGFDLFLYNWTNSDPASTEVGWVAIQ